jgi:hypothetical protein
VIMFGARPQAANSKKRPGRPLLRAGRGGSCQPTADNSKRPSGG